MTEQGILAQTPLGSAPSEGAARCALLVDVIHDGRSAHVTLVGGRQLPRPRLVAAMRKAGEVEGLPVAWTSPVPVRMPAEPAEARLVGMQRQAEPREALAQLGKEASRETARPYCGFLPMLESDDEIVSKAHDDPAGRQCLSHNSCVLSRRRRRVRRSGGEHGYLC